MRGSPPEVGAEIAGRYRIERQLGAGVSGAVFGATDLITGAQCALKWMTQEGDGARPDHVIRELRMAGSLGHPNLVSVFDLGSHEGARYLVMESLDGETLAARMARGPMPPEECVPILVEAMRGVAAAHDHDLFHHALEPASIFIRESSGEPRLGVKVLDFGGLMAAGTPPYRAPEQGLARPSIDHRIDVYAFGVILSEALSGRPASLLEQSLHGGHASLPTLVPAVPAALEAVVSRALAREPELRYADLVEFADHLQPWAANVPPLGSRRAPAVELSEPDAPGIELLPTEIWTETTQVRERPRGRAWFAPAALVSISLGWIAAGVSWTEKPPAAPQSQAQADPTPRPVPAVLPAVLDAGQKEPVAASQPAPAAPVMTPAPKPAKTPRSANPSARTAQPRRVQHKTSGVSLADF